MGSCEEIFQKNEINNIFHNEEIFELIFQEFIKKSGQNVTFDDETVSIISKIEALKNQYIYTSPYCALFFEILRKNNYNMKQEIKDAIEELAFLAKPKKNKKIVKKLLNSPVIQDISFNGKNIFTIISEEYGTISFELASYHFRNNPSISEYIEHAKLPNRCHHHTYFLSQQFPDHYSITAQCKYYILGDYYHSYTYDSENNTIIDLCFNSILDKKQYYQIYNPHDLSVIKNSDVENQIQLVDSKTEENDRCKLLKIALYKQYLQTIGYEGSLEGAPKEKIYK